MYREQVLWIAPRATSFTAVCEHCLSGDPSTESYLSATVTGSMRLDAKRGWATCRRGHEIRVQRADPALTGVIR